VGIDNRDDRFDKNFLFQDGEGYSTRTVLPGALLKKRKIREEYPLTSMHYQGVEIFKKSLTRSLRSVTISAIIITINVTTGI